jgi:hypothetical protein
MLNLPAPDFYVASPWLFPTKSSYFLKTGHITISGRPAQFPFDNIFGNLFNSIFWIPVKSNYKIFSCFVCETPITKAKRIGIGKLN